MNIAPEEIKRVKGQGFLFNNDHEHFAARVITEDGVLNAAQFACLSEAAEKFGNGNIAFTTRLTVEVQGLTWDDIVPFQEFIAKEGMVTGGTGPKVRPVVACKGTVCTYGLIDTQGLAREIHERFYEGYRDVTLPHKFKIAVGGCPNNCVKPDLNDLGIVGQKIPNYNDALCKGCSKCSVEDGCPMDAATVTDGKLVIDEEKCNNCGLCVDNCRFDAIPDGEVRYKVYVGGRWGKSIRRGTELKTLFTRGEIMDVVEKAILLYKKEGQNSERFGSTVERLGAEAVERALTTNDLLDEKDNILGIATVSGATC